MSARIMQFMLAVSALVAMAPAAYGSLPAAAGIAPAQTSQTMILLGPPATPDGYPLQRAADGLFYVNAIVNGAPVRFLVDTGASMVVLTAADARRAGVEPGKDAYGGSADTANGQAAMACVTLDEVAVGGTRNRSVAAAVVREGLSVSLLGQTWLSRLASVTIEGDRMVLR